MPCSAAWSGDSPHPQSPYQLLLLFLPMSVPDLLAHRTPPCPSCTLQWGADPCRLCVPGSWSTGFCLDLANQKEALVGDWRMGGRARACPSFPPTSGSTSDSQCFPPRCQAHHKANSAPAFQEPGLLPLSLLPKSGHGFQLFMASGFVSLSPDWSFPL